MRMRNNHIVNAGKRIILYAGLFLVIAAASIAIYIHYKTKYDITAVIPDRLYRSSEMNTSRLSRLATKHGISHVIDLRHPELDDKKNPLGTTRHKIKESRQALLASGIEHISIPSTQIPDDAMIRIFLDATEDNNKQVFLIHCDHGIGRAGLYTAVYLMEHEGYSNEEARRAVSRYYSPRIHGRKHFRADYNKGKWIMEYVPQYRMRSK